MFGSYRIRGCVCGFARKEKKRCSCGKARYHYRYDIIDAVTGKRKQKETRGFPSKQEAEDEAKRILAELSGGTYIEGKDTTFREMADDWLQAYKRSGRVKQSTIDTHNKWLKVIFNYFDHVKIKDISESQYQDMLNDLKTRYAAKSVRAVHIVANHIFGRAVKAGAIGKNTTINANLSPGQKTVTDLESDTLIPKYLEKEELTAFLRAAQKERLVYYAVFHTLAYTGLRKGEALALKWRDVDLEKGTISVTKTLYNPKNNTADFALQTPKTKSSRRVVVLDQTTIDVLRQLREEQEAAEDAFVFVKKGSRSKYPLTPNDIGYKMHRILARSGIKKKLGPHSLRHTHTSLLAEADVSLEQIMDRLGHENDKITRAVYLHITANRRQEAARKFAELMLDKPKKRRKAKLVRKE